MSRLIKNELRKKHKDIRNNINEEELLIKSQMAIYRLMNLDEYKKAKSVFVFVNTCKELHTKEFIQKALADGKIVAVPKVTDVKHEMLFIKITSMDELSLNKCGILEPMLDYDKVISSDINTVIIVPALAIDKEGYRLGYGGGYYDKYLSENSYMASIGVVFEWQIVDGVPRDEFDVSVDIVISEKERLK